MLKQVQQRMETLRLRGMMACVESVISKTERGELAVQEVLLELLEAEYKHQSTRALENRIKKAAIPIDWRLDTFPYKKQPSVNKTQILSLAKLDFIQSHENIIFIGEPGTGKTGLATGLLRLALEQGYRGRFYKIQDLLDNLYASLADKSTARLLKTMMNDDVIVCDELGFLSLTPEQINIFFRFIDMRYQKKSTIITTNLDYPKWYDVFKNKNLVDAMLDRLKHHCITIRIDGDSLRENRENEDKSTKTTKRSRSMTPPGRLPR